ncbi:MAG: hypothetical protein ACE5H4_00740 [Candidatus Thorarchaeota archaeon]
MMGEGSERGRRGQEGQRESQDEEEIRRQMREIIDQIEREREDEETHQNQEQEGEEYPEEPEDSVKDAVKDLEREEEERREAYEDYRRRELEREEAREEARREREETADKEKYDDLEKKILDEFDKRGVDPEDMKKRWREQFVEDVMEYIGESVDGKEEGDDEEGDGETGQRRTEDDHSYFDDGSGQMYATQSSANESAGSETVAEPESESQKEDTEPSEKPGLPEGSASATEKEQELSERGNETEESEALDPEDQESVESRKHSELKTETSEEKPDSKSQESIRAEQGESLHKEEYEHVKKHPESAEEKTNHDKGEEDSEATESDTESSDWPEHYSREDEDWQRYLREIFNELDEELKEAIREYLRGLVEDEEDFEKLARKHGLESMLEDEETMEEVENYLRFRKALKEQGDEETDIEELAGEFDLDQDTARDWSEGRSMPEALRRLLNREGDWLMGQLVRAHFEQDYPTSEEELEEAQNDPEIRQMVYFNEKLEEARAWIELSSMRKRGELDTIVRNGRERYRHDQIKELSLKYRIPEDEVLAWLRGERIPALVGRLAAKKTREKQLATFLPELNSKRIESYDQLESIIDRQFPGLRQNRNFSKWMKQAQIYFQVMSAFSEQDPIEDVDVSTIAKESGISANTARNWVLKGKLPTVFRYLNEVFKNQERVLNIRQQLGDVQSAEDVRRILEETGTSDSISLWPSAERQWSRLRLYFEALSFLESGMLQSDVDRKLRLKPTTTKRWVDGVLPWPVRIAAMPNSERSMIQSGKLTVNLHDFKIDGFTISSVSQLRGTISQSYSGLAKLEDIDSLIVDFGAYLDLFEAIGGRKTIRWSELRKAAEDIGVSAGKARRWVVDGGRPEICAQIERAARNRQVVAELRKKVPAGSMKGVLQLLDRIYIAPHLRSWSNYNEIEESCSKYYKFLDMYESGISQKAIAEALSLDESTVYHWTKSRLPRILRLLQGVPREEPVENWKWLPTRIDGQVFSDWVEVPETLTNVSDVLRVLRQMRMRFQDFMYVIGFAVSDGYVQITSKTSFSLRGLLSKSYTWSKQALDDVSSVFSRVKPNRILRIKRSKDEVWELFVSSPLFVWFREVVLGLNPSEKKTHVPFIGDWILASSEQSRIAFVQGLADGDGYASPVAQRAGISSISNGPFTQALLESLGVKSYLHPSGVEIVRHDSIRRAAQLPLFRNALGRTKSLSELCDMLAARPQRKRVTRQEIEIIRTLSESGLSPGQIGLHLWRTRGISRNIATIGRIVKRYRFASDGNSEAQQSS